jgi:deoxycytidylate deaminase
MERVGQELVIGLVGAIGTDLAAVERALDRAFETVDYRTRKINLIECLTTQIAQFSLSPNLTREKTYAAKMDAGNRFRYHLKRNDALALLGIARIRELRKDASPDVNPDLPIQRCAYVFHSLKTPEEIETLRRVYKDNFWVIAAYASKRQRVRSLAQKIAAGHFDSDCDRYLAHAEQLVIRDEKEHGEEFGQNVRGSFWNADVFVDASAHIDDIDRNIRRFVELLFGHPFSTPTRDEYGMFQAHGSGLRSASAGRQVGAAITTRDGDVVTTGTNEVAKPLGGQYWSDDKIDHRDHTRPSDSNDDMGRNMIVDFLVRLQQKNWLTPEKSKLSTDELLANVEADILGAFPSYIAEEVGLWSLVEKARVKHIIEYIRAVHAEMAALIAAARRGVSVDNCTLYSTTFPCHECAKHIVMAGIHRVVFIEPYPKSRVADLYDDSIAVDHADGGAHQRVPFLPFAGIAPRRYMDLFAAPMRKDKDSGRWVDWEMIRRTRPPRLGGEIDTYRNQEQDAAKTLQMALGNQAKHEATLQSGEVI